MASKARQLAQSASAPEGRRNLAYNGAMKVAQRGEQTGQTTGNYTACDRFKIVETGDTVVTTSQSTDVPSGQGFANSLKIDVTTADASLAASDQFRVEQRLEGQDVQHLLYGTSGAKDLTISFWVKSPKTGTHILELRHADAAYFNNQAYTIASANTWQKVTLTFSGYTTTAFDDDNEFSFRFSWFLMAGSNFTSGTLNSNTWHNTTANRAVGQVNCVDDAANNFYITGVQLEVGSNTAGIYLGIAQITGATTGFLSISMPTTMRTTPTISQTEVPDISVFPGSNIVLSTFSIVAHEMHNVIFVSLGFASGGTANDAARVFINTVGSFVDFDAEI